MGTRVLRLSHLLFEELYRLFRFEVSDPALSEVFPTSLSLSPDLRNAKVYFALLPPPEESEQVRAQKTKGAARVLVEAKLRIVSLALSKVTPFLRVRLSEAVQMKRLPDLHFHRDRLAESSLRATAVLTTPAAESAPMPTHPQTKQQPLPPNASFSPIPRR